MPSSCFLKVATCCSCKKEFNVTFFASDGIKVDSVSPETCPYCDHAGFTTRFGVDPDSKWVGVTGSNG